MATESKLKDDIKKLETALNSKATSEKIKPKLKNQLAILKAELSALQKPAASKMSRAKQLRAKYKALYGVRFQGIDIEKDADIPAMRIGKRTSQGIKGNQYASKKQAKGNTYYEYRENRIDMKQPPKKYPKLEDGGYMAKGGNLIGKQKNLDVNKNGKLDAEDFKMLRGEKMAKGGKSEEKLNVANDEQKFGLNILQALRGFNGGQTLNGILELMGLSKYRFNQYASASTVMKVKKELKSLVKKGFVEEGGLGYKITQKGNDYLRSFEYGSYAHGGKTQGYDDREDERLAMKYGKIGSKDLDSTKARRDDARFEERGKMEDGGMMNHGGMMAKGGEFPMANSTMIGKMITVKLPNELESFKDKVVEEYSDSVMGKKGFWSKKYIVKKSEDGGMMAEGGNVKKTYAIIYFPNNKKIKKVGYESAYKAFSDYESEGVSYAELYENGIRVSSYPKMADGGMMAEGGEVNGDNMEMVVSQIKAIKHHAEELSKIVTPSTPIEAWVVAKIERSETDLSDVTHYLDGLKMEHGGRVSSSQHRLNR